jgi:hypothetical protein
LKNGSGGHNAALGGEALSSNLTGEHNTALGRSALFSNTTGGNNIAVGDSAGGALTTGSHNIYIKADAAAGDEARTLRIGFDGGPDGGNGTITRAFISGIRGVAITGGQTVSISASGQLGLEGSSRRFKDHITPLTQARRVVQGLRPVQFTYKPEFSEGATAPQYGLIAEEVAEVDPNLAITVDGRVESVRYQFLAPLLVAEVQRLEAERASLARELATLRAVVEQLQRMLPTQATAPPR